MGMFILGLVVGCGAATLAATIIFSALGLNIVRSRKAKSDAPVSDTAGTDAAPENAK